MANQDRIMVDRYSSVPTSHKFHGRSKRVKM